MFKMKQSVIRYRLPIMPCVDSHPPANHLANVQVERSLLFLSDVLAEILWNHPEHILWTKNRKRIGLDVQLNVDASEN